MKRFVLLTSLILTFALMAFAGIADGTWTAPASQGAPHILGLQTNGGVLTGTADGVQITNGKMQGNQIWFNLTRGGVAYAYKGTISGNQLDLHETKLVDGSGHRSLTLVRN